MVDIDLFAGMNRVPVQQRNSRADAEYEYQEQYMRLLRNYKPELEYLASLQHSLREERETFYKVTLPQIEAQIRADNLLSHEAQEAWINDLRKNMEQSLRTSEALLQQFAVDNLEDFNKRIRAAMDKV